MSGTATAQQGPHSQRAARPANRSADRHRIVLHLCCLAALLVMLYPLAWLVATSFKPADEILSSLQLLPRHIATGNY